VVIQNFGGKMEVRKVLLVLVLMILGNLLISQSITFAVDDVHAGPAIASWMFDFDDPGLFTHDGIPYTPGHIETHNWAYVRFFWNIDPLNPPLSSTICTAEDLDVLPGVAGVVLTLDDFRIVTFNHINTVNPNAAWDIQGQAGDERNYLDGIGEIYENGLLKLRAVNCRLYVKVPYPDAQGIRDILFPDGQNWQNNVGSGNEVEGSGWGTIDVANSDPVWVAEFDPNGFGQLRFTFGTFSHVIQDNYGIYDFDITVDPAPFQIVRVDGELPFSFRGTILDFSEADVVFDFDDGAVSGAQPPDADTLRTVMVSQVKTNPGGTLPPTINSITSMFWEIGTTLSSYTADITFDLEEVSGYTDPNDLRILRRDQTDADWSIWADYTLVDASHIRANNVSDFSDWTIGTTGDDPLPVELSSFTVSFTDGNSILNWATQSESNNSGWNIYRSETENFEESFQVNNDPIPGAGTTFEPTNYSFVDEYPVTENTTYRYWLESRDYSGATDNYGPISLTIPSNDEQEPEIPEFIIDNISNFPNPFYTKTEISFYIKQEGQVNVSIYNIKGHKIATIFDNSLSENDINKKMRVEWNGRDEDGKEVTSGIYFYKITTNDKEYSRKMLLLR